MSLRIKLDGNPVLKEVLEEKGDYYAVLGIVSEVKSDSEQKLGSFSYKNYEEVYIKVPIKKEDYGFFKEKLKENRYGVVLVKEGELEFTLRD